VDLGDDYARGWPIRHAVGQDEQAHLRLSMDNAIEVRAWVRDTLMPGPHIPITTSAGHYLSMQPAQSMSPRDKVWYLGTDWDALVKERDRYRFACEAVMEMFEDKGQAGDADTLIEILDIVERVLT
jgi:hypothetical protein